MLKAFFPDCEFWRGNMPSRFSLSLYLTGLFSVSAAVHAAVLKKRSWEKPCHYPGHISKGSLLCTTQCIPDTRHPLSLLSVFPNMNVAAELLSQIYKHSDRSMICVDNLLVVMRTAPSWYGHLCTKFIVIYLLQTYLCSNMGTASVLC